MRRNSIKSMFLIVLCILFALSFSSCAKVAENQLNDENKAEDTAADADNTELKDEVIDEIPVVDDPEPAPKPEVTEPKIINPLTGEEVEEDISMNRPVAVMINNISVAMPQLGVSNADIIYEMMVEGSITRMCAIFQDLDESEILGSIRSSRHNYLDLVKAYDAIYVHAGGSYIAYDHIETRNIDSICGVTGRSDLFYRDQARLATMAYEHTLCITGESIINYLNNESDFRLQHEDSYESNMVFSDDVKLVNGQSANSATVEFGLGKTTKFIYNADTQKYGFVQHGETYVDGNTNEAVEFKNVIVVQTEVWSIDSADRKDMTLTGNGNGWFICNGEIAEITWSRSDNDAQFEYTYSDGTPLEYGVGTTYVCVISNSGSVEVE